MTNIYVSLAILTGLVLMTGCAQPQEPPSQVIYRFDDHRYLELQGWYCEGALFYVDPVRGIRSEVASQFYRAFGEKFVHPSERYIAIPSWNTSAFLVSKNYGATWRVARFGTGFHKVEPDGSSSPSRENILSFTVINDQGFLLTRQGNLYMSSKPFDDPRILPGGAGIDYVDEDGDKHHMRPGFAGAAWGMSYIPPRTMKNLTASELTNWQNLPTRVPEVINYKGWDRMRCNMDKGLQP